MGPMCACAPALGHGRNKECPVSLGCWHRFKASVPDLHILQSHQRYEHKIGPGNKSTAPWTAPQVSRQANDALLNLAPADPDQEVGWAHLPSQRGGRTRARNEGSEST